MKKLCICKQFLEFINEELFKKSVTHFSAKIFLFMLEFPFTFLKLKIFT